jgi:hypothetical protein
MPLGSNELSENQQRLVTEGRRQLASAKVEPEPRSSELFEG